MLKKILKIAFYLFIVVILFSALFDDLRSQRETREMEASAQRARVASVAGISTIVDARSIIELTNIKRRQLGLNSLVEDDTLSEVAQLKAEQYAQENYFDHPESDGTMYTERLKDAGYDYSYAGENLIVEAVSRATPSRLMSAWVSSEGHYANIIQKHYEEIGVGVAVGLRWGEPAVWVVQLFGSQRI